MSRTATVKTALKQLMASLPATTDGTAIQAVVGSGQDAFEKYPTIRVLPAGISLATDEDGRWQDYTMNFIISLYLDMGQAEVPDETVVDTLIEFQDIMFDAINTEWLPATAGNSHYNIGDTAVSAIDTVASKTGVALYCDIQLPITYREAI